MPAGDFRPLVGLDDSELAELIGVPIGQAQTRRLDLTGRSADLEPQSAPSDPAIEDRSNVRLRTGRGDSCGGRGCGAHPSSRRRRFADRRVGVVGTGSTGIQSIPRIARQAEHLYVFQRTANFSMPAHNRPLHPDEQRQIKARYDERRPLARQSEAGVPILPPERATFDVTPEERRRAYEAGWRRGGINALSAAFTDFFTDGDANETAAEFAREKIRQTVHDPEVAEALAPRLNPIGTKRTCVDIDYFETYNRDNVELVDVRGAPRSTLA
jgi:cation diffusion facilitator CzcD-associated flavoprotein CzcO